MSKYSFDDEDSRQGGGDNGHERENITLMVILCKKNSNKKIEKQNRERKRSFVQGKSCWKHGDGVRKISVEKWKVKK